MVNQHSCGKPTIVDLEQVVKELWLAPEREFHYIALALLDKEKKKLTVSHLPLLEFLITTKSWWDTVDHLASGTAGGIGLVYPEESNQFFEKWVHSDHMWLNRTALLYQLKYKSATDVGTLFRYIKLHHSSNEFFIQKAIGWALREYSKTNPQAVRQFISEEPLAPLSKREGSKHINRLNSQTI
ncbi:DNA alkylation repair protein [Bacillus sp. 2205SS5-2]|uniref:DNA alkylation repair protein n=1 Tax=Bacillus sp. 2205SS5-2 TaxID=3109031 RepID=UPI0030072DE6